jgi:hypothetical protein
MKINTLLGTIVKSSWYIVDCTKAKSVIVSGPFKTQDAAFEEKAKRGWSDKPDGSISHEVMSGKNCLAEGIKFAG